MRSRLLSFIAPCLFLFVVILLCDADEKTPSEQLTAEQRVREAIPQGEFKPKQPRRMLVFSVTRGYRHGSIGIGKKAFQLLGEKTGAYEAVVSDDLANFEKGKIEQFDTICFLNTTLSVFRPNARDLKGKSAAELAEVDATEARLKANLLEFVKSGGGFVGIHAATDTYYDWPEYGEMIGGYFNGHPWGHNTAVSIKADEKALDDPIIASLGKSSLDFKEEIYQFKAPYDSKKLNVLLRLDTEKSNMKVFGVKREDGDFGVSWTKSYGRGRVFYCALGHNEHIYWNPTVLSIYLNGVRWSMGDLD